MIFQIVGKPGSGKSTLCAMIAHNNAVKRERYYKRVNKSKLYQKIWYIEKSQSIRSALLNHLYPKDFYDVVYCTEEDVQDTIHIEYHDMGRFEPTPNSLFLCDEAGVGLSSRNFKDLSKYSSRFCAIHRHKRCDIILFSQSNDTDKKYRDRVEHLFTIRKIGKRSVLKKIEMRIDIDPMTHDFVNGYFKQHVLLFLLDLLITTISPTYKKSRLPMSRSMIFNRKKYYKYFDSYHDNFNYPDEDPYLIRLRGIDEPTDPYDIYIKEQLKREAEEFIKEESEVEQDA